MTNIRAKVTPTSGTALKAKVTPSNEFLVTNYSVNAGNIKLGDIFDVDISNVSDGAVILYNGNREVWEATPLMNNQNTIINGGNF